MIITAVGDVSFGRTLSIIGSDNIDPEIIKIIAEGDIRFCNFESPITNSEKKQKNHYSKILNTKSKVHLKCNENSIDILKKLNFNIVNLANNHIMDYNQKGLLDTICILEKHNVSHFGAGKNIIEARKGRILEIDGKRIGFLGYSYTYEASKFSGGSAPIRPWSIYHDIREMKKISDFLIVSLHFGEEYTLEPSEKEKKLCHKIIDCGADVILGHHPHVLRSVELYKKKVIAYSLGNFIFDNPYIDAPKGFEKISQRSMILRINTDNNEISFTQIPVKIEEPGLPRIQSENNMNEIEKENKHPSKRNSSKLMKIIIKSIYTFNLKNFYLIFMRYIAEVFI